MSAEKAKGTRAETLIANFLRFNGYRSAARRAAAGKNDKGDVWIPDDVPWLTIESKDQRTMKLAEWVDEANKEAANAGADVGVVWHHRMRKGDPHDWYVTMSGDAFVRLLRKAAPPVPK